MQALTPLMNEVKEKYKDDPQKMNTAVMQLYKDYGVNPAAGCLPLLLQMPILFALYSVFRSSIELRQASFVGWITDLSIPDSIAHLPFRIPLIGMDEVSGLAADHGGHDVHPAEADGHRPAPESDGLDDADHDDPVVQQSAVGVEPVLSCLQHPEHWTAVLVQRAAQG